MTDALLTTGSQPPVSLAPGEDYALGIDLGGTEIKAASMRLPDGACLGAETAPTRDGEVEGGEPAFLGQVRRLAARHEGALGKAARHIGLSAPGLANKPGSAIAFMPGRLRGLEGLVWKSALDRRHIVPVLNDAHAALMGESWLGAARGLDDVVMLTLGTGVGGAIISGGRLLRGHIGRAGQLGHLTIDFKGEPDICGTPGSVEGAIGEATVQRRSGGKFSNSEALAAAAAVGDPQAAAVWLESVRALAAAVVSIVNAVDPEAIVIGGGIARAGDQLMRPLQGFMDEMEWRPDGAQVRLCFAELGIWAGAFGAAYHAWQSARQQRV